MNNKQSAGLLKNRIILHTLPILASTLLSTIRDIIDVPNKLNDNL